MKAKSRENRVIRGTAQNKLFWDDAPPTRASFLNVKELAPRYTLEQTLVRHRRTTLTHVPTPHSYPLLFFLPIENMLRFKYSKLTFLATSCIIMLLATD